MHYNTTIPCHHQVLDALLLSLALLFSVFSRGFAAQCHNIFALSSLGCKANKQTQKKNEKERTNAPNAWTWDVGVDLVMPKTNTTVCLL